MADSLNRRRWSGWCLVPGPVDFAEPEFSFDMQDPIAEYRASSVAEVALSIPRVRLTHSALPSWWDWGVIDLAMTLFDDDVDPPSFGGFNVTADCAPSEMFALWVALRREFVQVWLHSPDCRLYKPESFSTEFV